MEVTFAQRTMGFGARIFLGASPSHLLARLSNGDAISLDTFSSCARPGWARQGKDRRCWAWLGWARQGTHF